MDILMGEQNKKYIRLAIWLLRKKLGEDVAGGAAVHADMNNTSNPVVKLLCDIVNKASENVYDEEYQRNTVRELGELALWIVGKDTAYRDILMWIVKEVINNKDAFEIALENYYKEPDEWYVNLWSAAKKKTAEMRKKGLIPKHGMSPEEAIFTASLQKKMLEKY